MSTDTKKPLHILVGVPSFRGTIMTRTAAAIINLVSLCAELGIKVEFLNVESAEIIVVRNTIASYVVANDRFTHLFFVDDDMEFESDAIIDLLRANKPLIGCVCPKRSLNLQQLYETAKTGAPFEAALSDALDFVTRHISHSELMVENGICRMAGIGMAVTLIKREVFTTMVERGVVQVRGTEAIPFVDAVNNPKHYGFFDQVEVGEVGAQLSEDLSFCHRWVTLCGGDTWALVNRTIGHIGTYVFAGKYLDRLHTGKP